MSPPDDGARARGRRPATIETDSGERVRVAAELALVRVHRAVQVAKSHATHTAANLYDSLEEDSGRF